MRVAASLMLLLSSCLAAGAAGAATPVAKPAGKAATDQCVATCSDQQNSCATTETMEPGADRKSLCAARFRVCIERCDPHYLNYHDTIDAHPVKDPSRPEASPLTPAQRCIDDCGASSQNCGLAGNGSSACSNARAACVSRCNLPATR